MGLALLPLLLACAQVQEKRATDAAGAPEPLAAAQVARADHHAQAPCACKQRHAANSACGCKQQGAHSACPCKQGHAGHECPGMQQAGHECPGMPGHAGPRHAATARRDAAHAHDADAKLGPEPAGTAPRWVADAPLRAGMARVRAAADVLAHLEMGHLGAPQVTAQADEIRAAVDFMFAECRLAPEPDAALHPLLARLIGISAALKEHPSDPAPMADLRAVLTRYAELFEEQQALPAAG